MQKITIFPCPLDRVADGVAEIQQGPFAFRLAFVRGHNRRFDLDISADKRRQIFALELLQHLQTSPRRG